MELFSLIQQNLLSPPLLFFALGILARWLKSDLTIPEQLSKFLSLYLMLAIGFKGGVAIAGTMHMDLAFFLTMLSSLLMGFLQPFVGFFLLRRTTQLDRCTSAAVAAHYGSISMVTFVAAINFLELRGVSYAGYIVAVLALMEAPAIVSGLLIALRDTPKLTQQQEGMSSVHVLRHIATNGAVVLLVGSFVIGLIAGPKGMQSVEGFLVAPFQGILLLFLLDMGLLVAKRATDLTSLSLSLVLFGVYMPVLNAVMSLGLCLLMGLDKGTGFLLTVLAASASYIVATAAMRAALPQAKVAIYLPMSLAVTFPFNITLGIPLYFALAERFLS